uniref:Large ribosomal subunit protein uL4c n=1 Tax=Inkyuleea mariana TaxID=123988 RepID=A0A4D6WZJ3_9FLOR|nr:ribosomal protein L4 [Inkyuleea mariana]
MAIEKKLTYSINTRIKNESLPSSKEISLKMNNNDNKNMYIVHRALIQQLNTKRQRNAHTKTRSEVRGGGKKPWKQKGTGRARSGSIRSPLWRGGGVIFGPRNTTYTEKINKKEKKLAIKILIYNKFDKTTVIDNIANNLIKPNTKLILNNINYFGLTTKYKENILIIVSTKTQTLYLSLRNLPNIELIAANNLNVLSLMKADKILMTLDALNNINNIYND